MVVTTSRWFKRPALLLATLSMAAWMASHNVGAQDHDHSAPAAAPGQHDAGAHTHPAAAKLANPTKSTPQSIASGKKQFDSLCVACHGDTGRGDGKQAAKLDPKPSNLTDASWKHGSTDGEIFTVLRDGTKANGKNAMPSFASKMTANQMWDVVNYMRSLKQP